uniref:Uncharacterized protein n=1 Tax=Arundo donax TaxID=35708 RepID=A0A0A9AL83_ARUDO
MDFLYDFIWIFQYLPIMDLILT